MLYRSGAASIISANVASEHIVAMLWPTDALAGKAASRPVCGSLAGHHVDTWARKQVTLD